MTCRHSKGDPACSSTVGGYAWHQSQDYAKTSEKKRIEELEAHLATARADTSRLNAALQNTKGVRATPEPPATPDAAAYEIVAYLQVGNALVLKVLYPNCAKCSFEGTKICVYANTSVGDALLWRVIDPHFQDNGKPRPTRVAPGPSARFPGSEDGWADATEFAIRVLGPKHPR